MNRQSRSLAISTLGLLLFSAACGPAEPPPTDPPADPGVDRPSPDGRDGIAARQSALAKDLDGNPVYPDIDDDDDDAPSGGGGSTACSGGATNHLHAAASYDYDQHGVHTLTDSTFTLFLCSTHFPVGGAARAEVQKAVDLFNAVAGANIDIVVGVAGHQDIPDLFRANPYNSYMDIVDNGTVGFPCHAAGDTTSWAMNTCRHGNGADWQVGTSSVDHFVISVNARGYTFDTNPSATDYPTFENIAHEIGHAFGLNHSADWTDEPARVLLSTMQGNEPVLPAHDRGYLRHFYPGTAGSTLNLVASTKVRVPSATSDSGYTNLDFTAANPTNLYLSSTGNYLDCATQGTPHFQAQWLNQGQIQTSCTVKNRFRIGPAGSESSVSKVTLKSWEAAQMPAASQDRIDTSVTIPESTLSSLSKDVPYELTFKVDREGDINETDEADNVVTSTVTLRGSYFQCPFTLSYHSL